MYWGVPHHTGLSQHDPAILDRMVAARTPNTDIWISRITNIAGQLGMATISICALLFFSIRYASWQPAIYLIMCGTSSVLLTIALKALLHRPRPPHELAVPPYELSGSFPSGHTLNAVVMIGAIAYLALTHQHHRTTQVITISAATIFCLTIGASRIYLGHHWFTDVLGGWLLGLAWLITITTIYQYWSQRRHHHAINHTTPPPIKSA